MLAGQFYLFVRAHTGPGPPTATHLSDHWHTLAVQTGMVLRTRLPKEALEGA